MNHDVWNTNKENLGEAEKELWLQLETVLNDVLDELRIQDKIRTYYTENDKAHLYFIMDNMLSIAQNHNLLINLAKEPDKPIKFLEATSKFGFNETNSVNLTIQMVVLSTVVHTEIFKVFLLFHLKNIGSYKASDFNRILSENAPNTWNRLKPYVDSDFRNSLAHGTWAIINKKVVLFKDAKLIPLVRLELADFIMRAKTQNVLYSCLVNTIAQKFKKDYSIDYVF